MKIADIRDKYMERLDIYQKDIESYDKVGRTPDEFVTAYVQHYRAAVNGFFERVKPDDNPEGGHAAINEERMRAIAWQHSRYAWRRMEHALQAGFGSLSGYVDARAEAAAENEWAENMQALATDGWLPDMGGRIPNR